MFKCRKKGLEARKQVVQPVGAWFSQLGGLNYVHHMWEYPSLQERKEMRAKTWKLKGKSILFTKAGENP
jgi:NIPSNAP